MMKTGNNSFHGFDVVNRDNIIACTMIIIRVDFNEINFNFLKPAK